MKLLIERGFGGVIYPINPKYGEIGGLRCYPDLQSVEGPVDMVVLVTPAVAAPEALAGGLEAYKAALRAASFEVLLGFQLDDRALAYNIAK